MSLHNWLLLLVLSVLWGGSFMFNELALQSFAPTTVVFARILLAAVALYLLLCSRGQNLPCSKQYWLAIAVMGLLNNVLPFCLIVWGQSHISASVASILNATTPMFTVLLAHWFTQDERLAWNKLAGVVIGFVGVVILLAPDLGQLSSQFSSNLALLGQLAVLGAALSYAAAGVCGKRLSQYGHTQNSTAMLLAASVLSLPTMLLLEPPSLARLGAASWSSWLAIAALALLSTALAYVLYFRILASAGATNLLLVTFLIPISAMSLSFVVLGERLQLQAMLGMLVIFSGLLLIDGRLFGKRTLA